MTDSAQPEEMLPNIEFGHEPEWEHERRRPRFNGFPQRAVDRFEHGNRLKDGLGQAIQRNVTAAKSMNLDPDSVQLIGVETSSDRIEDVERIFGATVLDVQTGESETENASFSILVKFPSVEIANLLAGDLELYASGSGNVAMMTAPQRERLFDNVFEARPVQANDRIGSRLQENGFPESVPFFVDVDLWDTTSGGDPISQRNDLRRLCSNLGGRVHSDMSIGGMIVARIEANVLLVETLLEHPALIYLDLPNPLSSAYSDAYLHDSVNRPIETIPAADSPRICIIDSGVLSGHPLLRNWVGVEEDFETGKDDPADDQGHGTAVASLAMYGSIYRCLEKQKWQKDALIYSAKVLIQDPINERNVCLPEGTRAEIVFEKAIRRFHDEHGCRVFVISTEEVLAEGAITARHQHPWPYALDILARELDIVIVVLAGNVPLTKIGMPQNAKRREQFQNDVLQSLIQNPAHLIGSPATASLAVTVGSTARSDVISSTVPGDPQARPIDGFAGARSGYPSPFTKIGPGFPHDRKVIKPEFMAPGGNLAVLRTAGGQLRWGEAAFIGEPVARYDFSSNALAMGVGTSFSAPQIAHDATVILDYLERFRGKKVSANLVRAFLGSCSMPLTSGSDSLSAEDLLTISGYGSVNLKGAFASRPNNVRVFAEGTIPDDELQIFRIVLPTSFVETKGARGITASLAYDAPVNRGRYRYLERTLHCEVLRGITSEEIAQYRSKVKRTRGTDGKWDTPLKLPGSKIVKMYPSKKRVEYSTLQVRRREWSKRPGFLIRDEAVGPEIYVLVESRRYSGRQNDAQRFGLVLNLWHEDERVDLYQRIKETIRVPVVQSRVRVQRRG